MSESQVLPFVAAGFFVGVAIGAAIWLVARRRRDGSGPTGTDFRALFLSGVTLLTAGVMFSVVVIGLGGAWYLPFALGAIGLASMAAGWAKRSQWSVR